MYRWYNSFEILNELVIQEFLKFVLYHW